MNEKQFYDALADVPDVPGSIIENVERCARRSGVKRRAFLAACLLLAFIIPAMVLRYANTYTAYAEPYEAMDELQYAFEFLSGDGLGADYLLGGDDGVGAGGGNTGVVVGVGGVGGNTNVSGGAGVHDTGAASEKVSTNIKIEGARK